MKPIDYRKDAVYKAKSEPELIDVPDMLFVAVEGDGGPEGNPQFEQAMQILFGIVYTIKFWDKKHTPPKGYAKFSLTPLEGLWWTKSGREFDSKDTDDWKWQVMIRLPEFVTPDFFAEVVAELIDKKQSDMYKKAQLIHFAEGTSVQLMHLGPYSQEEADINKILTFIQEQEYTFTGKHHEIYFNDPRRTKPENIKTILRWPVHKAMAASVA